MILITLPVMKRRSGRYLISGPRGILSPGRKVSYLEDCLTIIKYYNLYLDLTRCGPIL